MFEASSLNRKNLRNERLVKASLGLMTGLLILPVVLILTTLLYKGGPVISFEFLFASPTNGMTAGGIFPALLGTILLVLVALIASVPLGVAAAIYLSEYAPDNWLTRIINLAIINLAGVPSIVHALFGVGAFVLFFQFGTSILAASLTLAVMTLPVVIVATRESRRCWRNDPARASSSWRAGSPWPRAGSCTGSSASSIVALSSSATAA